MYSVDSEIWKDVPGYEGSYLVSNMGRVKSVKRIIHRKGVKNGFWWKEKILKLIDGGHGYFVVRLCKYGVVKQCRVNILVAMAFIENKENHTIVMHLNDIKSDNRDINLKWGTHFQNCIHRHEVYVTPKGEESKKSLPITVIDPNGAITLFMGIITVSRSLKFPTASIGRHLKNGKSYKGYIFKYGHAEKKIA
jgi:hypothetical protein